MTENHIAQRSVGAVTILIPNYQEAIDHFVGTLGFKPIENTRFPEEKRWVLVSPGVGTFLLLAKANGEHQAATIGNQSGGRAFLFLTTEDFWRDYRMYMKRGVEFQEEPGHEDYGMVAVFAGKFGNRWDLMGPDSK